MTRKLNKFQNRIKMIKYVFKDADSKLKVKIVNIAKSNKLNSKRIKPFDSRSLWKYQIN
jgi:hypothetical protein